MAALSLANFYGRLGQILCIRQRGCIGEDIHGIRYHVWDWRHRSWEVGVCCDLTGGGFWEVFCFKILILGKKAALAEFGDGRRYWSTVDMGEGGAEGDCDMFASV